MPIDLVVRLEDGVRHVRAVIAVAKLDEALRPDELRRSDDAHRRAEHLDLARILEPLVADRHRAVRGGEDHVEEVLALEHLAEPALVLDLDGIAEVLEMREDAGVVARLAEDVEILGRADDARIGGERVGAGQQEGQAELVQLLQGLGVEGLGLRVLQRRLGLGVHERHAVGPGRLELGIMDGHHPRPKRGRPRPRVQQQAEVGEGSLAAHRACSRRRRSPRSRETPRVSVRRARAGCPGVS